MLVKDLKEYVKEKFNAIEKAIADLKSNEIAHLQTDVKDLQKFRWRTSGIVNGILTLLNLAIAITLIISKIL